jgi:hypothetical protein
MPPTLEATQTGADTYMVEIRPESGIPVTLYVLRWATGHYYVKRSPESQSYITKHTTFEAACKGATSRAKRYLASYARTHKRKARAA